MQVLELSLCLFSLNMTSTIVNPSSKLFIPPKFNIAHEKWWLEDYFSFWEGLFSVAMLNFQGVAIWGKFGCVYFCPCNHYRMEHGWFSGLSLGGKKAFVFYVSTLPGCPWKLVTIVSKLVCENYLGDVSNLLIWGFIITLLSTMDIPAGWHPLKQHMNKRTLNRLVLV